ncbi:MAG: YkgJ family cysteine cluster protein [Candidatus Helarchaeota archaeon]
MQVIARLKNILDNYEFKKIFKIFEPILMELFLPNIDFEIQKQQLENFNIISEEDLTLKKIISFQSYFKKLLTVSYINNPLKIHDLIRDSFLNRIAFRSPNCIKDCRDIHGCCHGNYSIDLIDYIRIIDEGLLTSDYFTYKNFRYRIKLKRVNKENVCSAFDMDEKICLIHKYKPPTCCKYPLISNTFIWNNDEKSWIGNCAHGGIWATHVSPIVLQSLNKLWVKSILLWNKEQDFFKKYNLKLSKNKLNLGKKILTIKSNNIYRRNTIINLLSDEFSKKDIKEILNLLNF